MSGTGRIEDGGGLMGRDPFGLAGQHLEGRYLVESAVAEGGFGVVYRGTHETLHKAVAVKVLKVPESLSEKLRGEFLESFAREARLIASLDHPAVVKVIDFGASPMPIGEVAPWMVLDWLTGSTLEEDLAPRRGGGGRPPAEALALLRPVFEALAAAHELGVAHRDVKPANLMLVGGAGRRGIPSVKLMDFGIAKVMSPDEGPSQGETQTRASFVAYSPPYASPEQVSRTRTGPWTDVHAMALVLTEVLCDRAPYEYGDALGLQLAVLAAKRPTPGALGVAVGAWEGVIAKALSVRPNERFQDCGAFLAALEEALPSAGRAGSVERLVQLADTVKREGPPSVPELSRASLPPSPGGTLSLGPPGPQGTLRGQAPERVSGVHTFSPAVTADRNSIAPRRRWPVMVLGGVAVVVTLAWASMASRREIDARRPAAAPPQASARGVEAARGQPAAATVLPDAGAPQAVAPPVISPGPPAVAGQPGAAPIQPGESGAEPARRSHPGRVPGRHRRPRGGAQAVVEEPMMVLSTPTQPPTLPPTPPPRSGRILAE